MIPRPLWTEKILKGWSRRSIVWLAGVRRVGKTTLSQFLEHATYLNCDLPSVQRQMADAEAFFDSAPHGSTLIFDEIHQTDNPSQILKIAADAYPHLKILATGSSTLAASKKYTDRLTGRKTTVFLPPVLWPECKAGFQIHNLDERLLKGGLPPALLNPRFDAHFYSEWLDSFYARDIQSLFEVRNRQGFYHLFKLLLRQSGGLVDYTSLSKHSGLSRPSVYSYIDALCITQAFFLLPPFHGGGRREITQRPKSYAFDTGFVCFEKGWDDIRGDDRGLLWEHLVLDALRTTHLESQLYYWRDKSEREIDFVIRGTGNAVHAVECKINPDKASIHSLETFRRIYAEGDNYVISPRVKRPYSQRHQGFMLQFHSLESWLDLHGATE